MTNSTNTDKIFLPATFILSDTDVICGRGRTCFHHAGNVRFREIVASKLPMYLNARTKTDKTIVICWVVSYIRQTSTTTPNGGFVKFDKRAGRYFDVGDFLAREKTSQAFRDIVPESYNSSNVNKRSIRRLIKSITSDDDTSATKESEAKCQTIGNDLAIAIGSHHSAYAWQQQQPTAATGTQPVRNSNLSRNYHFPISASVSFPELCRTQSSEDICPSIPLVNNDFATTLSAKSECLPPMQHHHDKKVSFFISASHNGLIDNLLQEQPKLNQQRQKTHAALMLPSNDTPVDEVFICNNAASWMPDMDGSNNGSQQMTACIGDWIRSVTLDSSHIFDIGDLLSLLNQLE